jgi:hypothetical protein
MLREQFGRRMKRSAHTRAATAIGLAIQADASQGYVLREQFTRHFGVWREADSGRVMTFDPLFAKGTQLPGPGEPELSDEREYLAVHNVAHFRYTECSQRSESGQPTGDLAVWDEVLFPVEPALSEQPELHSVHVERQEPERAQRIQERYSCDASGTVSVTIRNLSAGYERHYRLGRWAGKDAPVVPGRRKKKKAAAER